MLDVYPMHWIDPLISFFRLSVCLLTDRLSNDYVLNFFYRFSRNFACGSEIWSLRPLRFRQFSGSGEHIFRQISTKSYVQIKFSNADFVFNGEWNRK